MTEPDPPKRDEYELRCAEADLPRLTVRDLAFFRRLFLAHQRWLVPVGLSAGAGVLAGVCMPWILKEIIDGITPPAVIFPSLGLYVGLFAGLAVATQGAGFLRNYFQTRFRQALSLDIRRLVYHHVLALPPRFFDGEETGYLMSRVFGDAARVEGLVSGQLIALIMDVGKFIGGVAILFAFHAKLALAASLTLPLLAITVKIFRRPLGRIADRQMETQAAFFKDLQESLAGIHQIKSAAGEQRAGDRLLLGTRRIFSAEIPAVLMGGASQAALALVTSAGVCVVLGFGAGEVLAGRLTLGELVMFNTLLAYLYGPSRSLTSFPLAVQPALTAYKRISVLLAMRPETDEGVRPERLEGRLSMENVTFAYAGGEPVLKDLTWEAGSGERLGIVGLSGAGKSTLLRLLLGFYPARGSVKIDGRDVAEYAPSALRSLMGYLPQDTFLFADTIRGNLTWAAPEATEDEIRDALDVAGLMEFVRTQPQGLDTPVGERGCTLSGGERQRLALARMLLESPSVLLLDESTSYVDRETEHRIHEALHGKLTGRTLLVVAHRLSSLENVDRVLVLENGTLVEEGPVEELMKGEGPFSKLFG